MEASWFRWVTQVVLVRLRFPLIVLGVVGLIGVWPWLRNHFDRLVNPNGEIETSVSHDTEYWCPMCPGVVSEWPAKCPVCYMALVRRKKNEPVPLPDGVVARMQFSPYRVQLAGIRTSPAEYRPLTWDMTFAAIVAPSHTPGRVTVPLDIPESEIASVSAGQSVEIVSEAFPGQTFAGRVQELAAQVTAATRTVRVRVDVDDSRSELRTGMLVAARLRVPVTQLAAGGRRAADDWRDRLAVELALASLPPHSVPAPGLATLIECGASLTMRRRELSLAIPTTAVIDTGECRVVFVERMAGMFDGVEVTLGRRCGDYYPVLRGLEAGQAVVTAGAFLIDAETRLNPSLAAGYFGAASRPSRTSSGDGRAAPEKLSPEDEQLVAKQKLCPVTDAPLGSMGLPVRVVIDGKPVFICCKGCEAELRGHPRQYLTKLRGQ